MQLLFGYLDEVVVEVDAENVVQLVINNATTYVVIRTLLEKLYFGAYIQHIALTSFSRTLSNFHRLVV